MESYKVDAFEAMRLMQMEKYVPEWDEYMSYLYIGAGPYRHHFFNKLSQLPQPVDVVEFDGDSYEWLLAQEWLRRTNHEEEPVQTVFHDDIREWQPEDMYGAVLWSHGPEVLDLADAISTLSRLEECCSLMICMVPWETVEGNGNVSNLNYAFWDQMGYATHGIGEKGKAGSNLLAWKYVD